MYLYSMIYLYFYVKFQRFSTRHVLCMLGFIYSYPSIATHINTACLLITILCNGSSGVGSVSKLAAPFIFYSSIISSASSFLFPIVKGTTQYSVGLGFPFAIPLIEGPATDILLHFNARSL